MILRHRVALDGAQLDELDERILVLGASDGAAKETVSAVNRFGGAGQRVTSRHRESLDVAVRFGLRIKPRDMAGRSALFEKVAAWAAGGGWLTLSQKPNRCLHVTRAQLPAAGDPADWNAEYTLTFTAYGVPYWQQQTPTALSVGSTRSATRTLEVPGSADTSLNVSFKNLSGMEIATASIAARSSRFDLENLKLAANETLLIDHDDEGLLRIRIQGTGGFRSALACRTGQSDNDLTVSPGANTVRFTAQRAGQLAISCYGRYV
jgi:hypothetical protein